jgi:phosphate acyltransferase
VSTVIALDAMGGDHAPAETVAGAVAAVREHNLSILLVGPPEAIEPELARHGASAASVASRLEIVPAEGNIEMEEHAVHAVRNKPNAPLNVAARLVKEGRAAGFVSAGSTGAAMATALFTLGRVRGIERPALATLFPTLDGRCLFLDVGANADCRASYLAQFATMGSIYAERVLGVTRPRVGLLNIGEEETKGSQIAQEAHQLIKGLGLNFVGNIEGKDLPGGLADVVVADGFAGNIALKTAEGMAKLTFQLVKREVGKSWRTKLGGLLMKPAFKGALARVDYEEYGGAALLGVDGVVIVAHGRSHARAIRSALRVAMQAAEVDLVRLIREGTGR